MVNLLDPEVSPIPPFSFLLHKNMYEILMANNLDFAFSKWTP